MYLSFYNDLVAEEAKVPPTEAPVCLFLQKQLDRAAQEPDRSADTEIKSNLSPLTFGEEAEDFGFEP